MLYTNYKSINGIYRQGVIATGIADMRLRRPAVGLRA
jgi:hypothetical protein